MRLHEKHSTISIHHDIFNVNFHQFMELEGKSNHLEIAEELGISLRDVHTLKKKITRT